MTQGKGGFGLTASRSASSAAAQPASRTKTAIEILMRHKTETEILTRQKERELKDALDDILGVPKNLRAPHPEDRTKAEGEAHND